MNLWLSTVCSPPESAFTDEETAPRCSYDGAAMTYDVFAFREILLPICRPMRLIYTAAANIAGGCGAGDESFALCFVSVHSELVSHDASGLTSLSGDVLLPASSCPHAIVISASASLTIASPTDLCAGGLPSPCVEVTGGASVSLTLEAI